MKRAMRTVAGIVVAGLVIVGAYVGYRAVFVDRQVVYTQVDDAAAQPAPAGDNAKFDYVLPAYDEKGAESEVRFGTQRRLRDGAYLRLETLALRGVVGWEEVSWDEMPAPVQERMR